MRHPVAQIQETRMVNGLSTAIVMMRKGPFMKTGRAGMRGPGA
jgi:hypothetical protein